MIKNRATIKRFTLIEMLVVLAIAGVLLGIGLPAFQKLAKGQGTTLAARNLSGKLKAARAYAISKRQKVAVLFPKKEAANSLSDKYLCSSYRTCFVTGNNNSYTFKNWIEGENWTFLPTGTVVSEIDGTANRSTTNISFSPSYSGQSVASIDCSDVGETNTASMQAVVFKPNGTIDSTLHLSIDEGSIDGSNIQRTKKDDPGFNLRVDEFTGRISFTED
jgi:prepilin-type N-terminal cleavage/methylation domain-containing protein